jgi:hypothetical protein
METGNASISIYSSINASHTCKTFRTGRKGSRRLDLQYGIADDSQ